MHKFGRNSVILIGLAFMLALSGCEAAKQTAPSSGNESPAAPNDSAPSSIPYKQEVVAIGLDIPWEIDFAPDGRIFFTERGGDLRLIEKGKLVAEPVFRFEDKLYNQGEAGLLGLALDPKFNDNHYLYVYQTYMQGNQPLNRVVRIKESGGKATLDKVLLDGLPGNRIHDGGRVKFGPDGMLYVTNGDAASPSMAQDNDVLAGKILRINPDGSIPADNPFPNSPVYSLGHRNPQGLAWHPVTGQLYSSEHGQSAHDEINRIEPGANYGWPLIQGDETEAKPEDTDKAGPGKLTKPILHSSNVTWAPSGMTFISQGPWTNHLLTANLRGTQVLHVVLTEDGKGVHSSEGLLQGELGRIRTVTEAPDGSIYILTNNRDGRGTPKDDDDKIVRLIPTFNK
ncbi:MULTISPECIES: PQQ-dependent sugar dehydrogenase [unclassified Paenibacillus]|uniref:PQQ-dependent sugar dehydrogenase n=1 Tax=unclassified Paenibacillus TaxID=185978 RepID=UPI001B4FCA01|nr:MULTISPECIES: PQQ-dependent sugar dehydrogenase [unclassified Paenibacillus]MBP1153394.1 glucose/arabinose dehydrogenase [Paenibacillus sp. PvP091]MBP1171223.1 glucose/arabinose dehydrogenase [Paenibacillus sp. PvR098]MBP2442251.1 glucose/arabinose dehydrogenase [Paenibacillus sp. PvP052]